MWGQGCPLLDTFLPAFEAQILKHLFVPIARLVSNQIASFAEVLVRRGIGWKKIAS
jgi:hypothetical protein